MNKVLKFSTLLAFACIPLSSQAWWGPYGGNPYGGGYAPAYANSYPVAPYYPAYRVPAYPVYGTPWTRYRYAPRPPIQGPWGRPMGAANDTFALPADIQARFKRSKAERKQAMELSASRRAAFQKRMQAQRAAMKARREAWRQRMNQYSSPKSMPTAPQPMPPAQPQAAPPAPTATP